MSDKTNTVACPGCKSLVFVRHDRTIVSHYAPNGFACASNEAVFLGSLDDKNEAPERVWLCLSGGVWTTREHAARPDENNTEPPCEDAVGCVRADIADAWRERAERAEKELAEIRATINAVVERHT